MSDALYVVDVIRNQNGGVPLTLSNPITSAVNFPLASGGTAALNMPTTEIKPRSGLAFPAQGISGTPFRLKVGGTMTGTTTQTFQVSVCLGLVAGTTPIMSPSASQSSVASSNWYYEATLLWDSVSTELNGVYSGWTGTTISSAVTTTRVTAATASLLVFSVNAIFSATGASNVCTVTQFSADPL